MVETFVSVVVPLRDDAGRVAPLLNELRAALAPRYAHYEVILVDDGSRDRTVATVVELLPAHDGTRLLVLTGRFGVEAAMLAGLDAASGDFIVTLSAREDPPALVPELVERCRRGADVVTGTLASRSGQPAWLRAGATLFYWYTRRFLGLALPANATHFRCLSRQAVTAILQLRDNGGLLRVFTSYIGYATEPFTYARIPGAQVPRSAVASVKLALSIILDNSVHPLRLLSWMGIAAAVLNVVYGTYVVVLLLVRRDLEPGWATISLQLAAQFFLLSLMVAALCEYVGRLSVRSARRPLYHVRQEFHSTNLVRGDRLNVVGDGVP